jgi:two-component system cell cycle sensor histidine kinase/response regulator CckA
MKDEYKTKKQLINELLELRQRIAELVTSESQRKQTEEALHESMAKVSALAEEQQILLNHTRDFVYRHDIHGIFNYLSPAVKKITGYSVEEWHTHYTTYLTDNPINEKVIAYTEKTLRTGTDSPPYIVEIRHKDGRHILLEVNERAYFRDEEVAGIIGVARDVTERMQAEEEVRNLCIRLEDQVEKRTLELKKINEQLKQEIIERKLAEENLQFSKKYLESILSNSLDLIITIKKDGIIGYTNHQLDKVTGYQQEEVLGKHFMEFIPEHRKELILGKWRELNEGIAGIFEAEIIKADGTLLHCLISSSTLEGFDEFLVSIKDITKRKLAEKALIDSEEHYRRMVSAITTYTYSVEVKDGQAIFTRHSIGCLPVTGYKPEDYELEPYLWYTMIHPEDQVLVGNSFNEILAGREVPPVEHRLIRRDGSIVWVRNTMVPYTDEEGRLIRYDGLIEDITERKQAEEAMQESESKFRTLAQTNAAAIFIIQGNNFQYVNPALEAFTGYSKEELLTINFWDVVHPKFQELVKERGLRRQRGEKVPLRYEFKIITKGGETRWLDTTAGLIEYKGKPATIAVAFETTDRKHAEEALRESEEKFRAISSTAVDAILVMDNEGKILYWNPAAERMFGYAREEAMGKELHLFLAPERYHDAYKKGFSKFIETGKGPAIGNTSEFFAIRKDGIEFPIEVSTSAIQVKGQWHSIGIVRDITERKIAEKALQESEQNYRSLFEESKDVVYISTPEGKFLDINPAGVELFGYSSKEEILQINITRDLYANPGDREYFQQILTKQGYAKDYEVVFKRKDGEQLIVLLTTTAVHGENGNTIAYRGIIKDITKWKRLEQQFLQAQKMEAIGQLAGGVAHDFNNILTAIIGYGSLLKIETSEDDLLRSYVIQILNSAERAANLTKALLAFSRRQIIRPKPVNLNEIITVLEKLLSRIIGEDIELSTALIDKDLTVMADSIQLEQVLMNLVTNARDAMPDGGSLTITTEFAVLDNEFIKAHGFGRPGMYALISVEDTGQGMDEKTKERIFEPFFTTKEVGKGTGLGLAMVYGIIKQHDGYINVYSEPVKGTTFKIYLPLIKSKVEEVKLADLPIIKGGIETILVAEDDAQVRELTKEVLEGFGYKVMEATDGDDATKIFNENKDKIQLLFLDVIMPKKNGKEVYDEIKKVRPDIKAIFTSGYDADIIHKKGILEEGLDFITKPILPDELLRMVREVLDK